MIINIFFVISSLGIIALYFILIKILNSKSKLELKYPDEPWRWRKDWNEGVIYTYTKAKMIFFFAFAALINIPAFLVIAQQLPGELREGKVESLLIFLYPLAGFVVLGYALYYYRKWQRFGSVRFQMKSVPGVLGGKLEGAIRVPSTVLRGSNVYVRLECVKKYNAGSGDHFMFTEYVLWQAAYTISGEDMDHAGQDIIIPVNFDIPYDQPQPKKGTRNVRFFWRLRILASLSGVDFSEEFEVPVFRTRQSNPARTTDALGGVVSVSVVDEGGNTSKCYQPPNKSDRGLRLRQAGLRLEPSERGGIRIVSPILRQPFFAAANLMLFIGSVYLSIVLWLAEAPIYFPIVLTLFSIIIPALSLDIWIGKWCAEVSRDGIRLWHGPFGRGTVHHIHFSNIKAIDMQKSIQSNQTQYYSVIIFKHSGGKIRVINRLLHKDASILVEALHAVIDDYSSENTGQITIGRTQNVANKESEDRFENTGSLGERLEELGLHLTSGGDGVMVIEFPRLHYPKEAKISLLFLAVMFAAYIQIYIMEIPAFMLVLHTLWVMVVITITLYLNLWELRIEVGKKEVVIRRGLWGRGLVSRVNLGDIERVEKKMIAEGVDNKDKSFYTVFFKKNNGRKVRVVNFAKTKEAQLVAFALQTAINNYRR